VSFEAEERAKEMKRLHEQVTAIQGQSQQEPIPVEFQ